MSTPVPPSPSRATKKAVVTETPKHATHGSGSKAARQQRNAILKQLRLAERARDAAAAPSRAEQRAQLRQRKAENLERQLMACEDIPFILPQRFQRLQERAAMAAADAESAAAAALYALQAEEAKMQKKREETRQKLLQQIADREAAAKLEQQRREAETAARRQKALERRRKAEQDRKLLEAEQRAEAERHLAEEQKRAAEEELRKQEEALERERAALEERARKQLEEEKERWRAWEAEQERAEAEEAAQRAEAMSAQSNALRDKLLAMQKLEAEAAEAASRKEAQAKLALAEKKMAKQRRVEQRAREALAQINSNTTTAADSETAGNATHAADDAAVQSMSDEDLKAELSSLLRQKRTLHVSKLKWMEAYKDRTGDDPNKLVPSNEPGDHDANIFAELCKAVAQTDAQIHDLRAEKRRRQRAAAESTAEEREREDLFDAGNKAGEEVLRTLESLRRREKELKTEKAVKTEKAKYTRLKRRVRVQMRELAEKWQKATGREPTADDLDRLHVSLNQSLRHLNMRLDELAAQERSRSFKVETPSGNREGKDTTEVGGEEIEKNAGGAVKESEDAEENAGNVAMPQGGETKVDEGVLPLSIAGQTMATSGVESSASEVNVEVVGDLSVAAEKSTTREAQNTMSGDLSVAMAKSTEMGIKGEHQFLVGRENEPLPRKEAPAASKSALLPTRNKHEESRRARGSRESDPAPPPKERYPNRSTLSRPASFSTSDGDTRGDSGEKSQGVVSGASDGAGSRSSENDDRGGVVQNSPTSVTPEYSMSKSTHVESDARHPRLRKLDELAPKVGVQSGQQMDVPGSPAQTPTSPLRRVLKGDLMTRAATPTRLSPLDAALPDMDTSSMPSTISVQGAQGRQIDDRKLVSRKAAETAKGSQSEVGPVNRIDAKARLPPLGELPGSANRQPNTVDSPGPKRSWTADELLSRANGSSARRNVSPGSVRGVQMRQTRSNSLKPIGSVEGRLDPIPRRCDTDDIRVVSARTPERSSREGMRHPNALNLSQEGANTREECEAGAQRVSVLLNSEREPKEDPRCSQPRRKGTSAVRDLEGISRENKDHVDSSVRYKDRDEKSPSVMEAEQGSLDDKDVPGNHGQLKKSRTRENDVSLVRRTAQESAENRSEIKASKRNQGEVHTSGRGQETRTGVPEWEDVEPTMSKQQFMPPTLNQDKAERRADGSRTRESENQNCMDGDELKHSLRDAARASEMVYSSAVTETPVTIGEAGISSKQVQEKQTSMPSAREGVIMAEERKSSSQEEMQEKIHDGLENLAIPVNSAGTVDSLMVVVADDEEALRDSQLAADKDEITGDAAPQDVEAVYSKATIDGRTDGKEEKGDALTVVAYEESTLSNMSTTDKAPREETREAFGVREAPIHTEDLHPLRPSSAENAHYTSVELSSSVRLTPPPESQPTGESVRKSNLAILIPSSSDENGTGSTDQESSSDEGSSADDPDYTSENFDPEIDLPGWWDCLDDSFATMAHAAAAKGYREVLAYLCFFFDVFAEIDSLGRTPLWYAAESRSLECVTLLLASGGTDWVDVGDAQGRTVLHAAAMAGAGNIVTFLIDAAEATANIADATGLTPAHLAADDRIIELLDRPEVELYCIDNESHMPLYTACEAGKLSAARALLERMPVDWIAWPDEQKNTALHIAAANGHSDCCAVICEAAWNWEVLNAQNERGYTPAHVAANTDTLEVFYSYAADYFIPDRVGRTPLFVQAGKGRAENVAFLCRVIAAWKPDEIGVADRNGDDALHAASIGGHLGCVKALVGYLPTLERRNGKGLRALDLAKLKNHETIVAFLEEESHRRRISTPPTDSSRASPTASQAKIDAAKQLHGSRWCRLLDETSGKFYYFDRATCMSQWDCPADYDEQTSNLEEENRCRAILMTLYAKENPGNLKNVDRILNQYRGRLDEMLETLAAKYNVTVESLHRLDPQAAS